MNNCPAVNHTKSVLLPEEHEYVNSQNFKRFSKAPFIINGDFECVLTPSADNINFGLNIKTYQDHIICKLATNNMC